MSIFTLRAVGATPVGVIDSVILRRAIQIFLDPSHHVFLQALKPAASACILASDVSAVEKFYADNAGSCNSFFAINPVGNIAHSMKSEDALYRRWLLVDVDRNKTFQPNDPATDKEHDDCKALTYDIQTYLAQAGFPAPIQVDSGNGFHLYYRLDLPNDDDHKNLVHDFLKLLDNTFSDDRGDVGAECYDARRLSRMPGTWSRRGAGSAGRPFRQCKFVSVPTVIEPVPADLMRNIVAGAVVVKPPPDAPTPATEPPALAPPPSVANGHTSSLNKTASVDADRKAAYGQSALDRERAAIAGAPKGQRNNQLFKSAAALYELVFGGVLEEYVVRDTLFAAAVECGLGADQGCGDKGIIATIDSGKVHGKNKPRAGPEEAPTSGPPTTTNGTAEKIPGPQIWRIELDDKLLIEGEPKDLLGKIEDPRANSRVFAMYTIGGLIEKEFPEPKWVVPGLLSEGLNILAGKPKQGKSMLALNLAITIAAGGHALGDIKTIPGDVLYLSLEDKARRVRARAIRMMKKLGNSEAARRLTIATEWPRQDQGGIALIDHWYKNVIRPVLVIIDVWGMFKTPYTKGGSQYEQDSQQLGAVKKYVDQRSISAKVLMHCRKGASEDVIEEVTGTMGITGVADGIMVLNRIRNNKDAKIFITGRDVPEKELIIEFDDETFTWTSRGAADEYMQGKLQEEVMKYMKANKSTTVFAKQISDALDVPGNSIRKTLERLRDKGLIRQNGHGWMYPAIEDVIDGIDGIDEIDFGR